MSTAFNQRQENEIRRTLTHAETETGLRFSVYVGQGGDDSRTYARRLHAALGDMASRSVLVFADPGERRLEIVTGEEARELLDDRTCALAALTMTTAFSVGDLAGGICDGVNMLREQARRPPLEHQHAVD